MNCPDHETLSAFFDGEAPDAGDHVAACGECRAFLDDLTAIREAVIAARPALGRTVSPGAGSREPGAGERAFPPATGAFPPTPYPRLPTPRRRYGGRLPVLAFALLLLVLLAIPAVLLLRPKNRDEGVFGRYDSGGRAVIYLRGRE